MSNSCGQMLLDRSLLPHLGEPKPLVLPLLCPEPTLVTSPLSLSYQIHNSVRKEVYIHTDPDLSIMAPIKDVDGTNTDVQILLVLLSNCGEMDLDSRALAGAFGITRTDNAYGHGLTTNTVHVLTRRSACAKSNRFSRNMTTSWRAGESLELMEVVPVRRQLSRPQRRHQKSAAKLGELRRRRSRS